ncbi:MAG: choice-of-anchor Q domain-containing protein [Candidatus Omnitrophica bacterium]|nr:choice-of-anchor Q domain-containing protein [Candidatus Omnitrophota bacterium]
MLRSCKFLVIVGIVLFIFNLSYARDNNDNKISKNTIYIPRDFSSIQNAIDNAKNGDVLLVSPGRYVGTINFRGKAITIKSSSGPGVTIMDGNKNGSVVIFESGENNKSVLEGFTIENGLQPYGQNKGGGGVFCYRSGPLIKNNIIKNNKGENGGGMLCLDCLEKKPLIISNVIKNNEAVKGGGIRCSDSSPIIVNNIITANNAGRLGGGIYWRQSSSPCIVNNTIFRNTAGEYGGGVFGSNAVTLEAPVVLSNNILWENRAPKGTQLALNLSGTKVTVTSSDVQYGKAGVFLMTDNISLNYFADNISSNPRIKDTDSASLAAGSACIDAGENKYLIPLGIAVDFNGNDRILDGDNDGAADVDIGACEFTPVSA